MEDQLPAGGGGVDRLGDALKPDLPIGKTGDRLDEVLEGAAQPVKAPDDQGVARANLAERLVEAHTPGRKGGRPKALTPKKAQQLLTLYNDKTNTIDEICRTLHISRATLYRHINAKS